jgi:putative hydrolase of the HAD superfamily
MRIDWDNIDTVLLDMDGTLIDRKMEDHFWDVVVPTLYAKKHGFTFEAAKADFIKRARAKERSADWGNVSYWEKDLGVKLRPARKKALSKARLHPHTIRFIKFLRKQEKKIYLVTGADAEDTKVKLTFTKMLKCFDGVYTQPELGASKSSAKFWKVLQKKLGFDKNRTVLADDNIIFLRAAGKFGIKYLIFKTIHNSEKPPHERNELLCVRHFDDIISD